MPTATRLPSLTSLLRRPVTWIVVAAGVLAAGVALALFQPWKLWVDQTVNEAAPVAGAPSPSAGTSAPGSAPGSTPGSTAGPAAGSGTGPAQSQPRVLAQGDLISHEHATTGSVRIIRLADGARILRLENLDTSNGPDLKVWITDARVVPGRAGWHVFDDGRYVSLGRLKGNKGSQNYPVPADVDLSRYSSVSIWCDRFNVSFGAATLTGA